MLFLVEVWHPKGYVTKLKNYTCVCQQEKVESFDGRGGGVSCYCHNSLVSQVKEASIIPAPPKCQIISVKICGWQFVLAYRSPTSLRQDEVEFVRTIRNLKPIPNVIALGDFNIPKADWTTSTGRDALSRDFTSATTEKGLKQMVQVPTHVGGNCLDLVLTTIPEKIRNLDVSDVITHGGHSVISFDVEVIRRGEVEGKEITQHNSIIPSKYQEEVVAGINRLDVSKNFNEIYSDFCTVLSEAYDRTVPKKYIVIKNYECDKKNYALSTVRQIRLCRSLRKKGALAQLSTEKRKLKRLMEHEKDKAFRRYCAFLKKDRNNIYREMNSGTQEVQIKTTRNASGELCTDLKEVVDIIARFYSSVFTEPRELILELSPVAPDDFIDIEISEQLIIEILSEMKNSHGCGVDNVSNCMLKLCAHQIAPFLAQLFRYSLDSGELPSDWMVARAFPFPKKDDPTYACNTRGLNMTSCICKLFERCLVRKLTDHLERKNFYARNQFGFRRKRSTMDSLLLYTHKLSKCEAKGLPCDVILFDFVKCFDRISHSVLLEKSYAAGVKGKIWQWLRNWLNFRTFFVEIDGVASANYHVKSSVVQGSSLGPACFLLVVNDLPSAFEFCESILFCDDFRLLHSVESPEKVQELQRDINNAVNWANQNTMQFNISKCESLHFFAKSESAVYSMEGKEIRVATRTKDLGIIFDTEKMFQPHIDKVIDKATRAVATARKVLRGASWEQKCQVWYSYVLSSMMYGSCAWNPVSPVQTDRLNGIYREFFAGERPGPGAKIPLCVSQEMLLRDLLQIYDIQHKKSPLLREEFLNINEHGHWLRSDEQMEIPSQPSLSELSLIVKRRKLWNEIPPQIQTCQFKSSVRAWITRELCRKDRGQALVSQLTNGRLLTQYMVQKAWAIKQKQLLRSATSEVSHGRDIMSQPAGEISAPARHTRQRASSNE